LHPAGATAIGLIFTQYEEWEYGRNLRSSILSLRLAAHAPYLYLTVRSNLERFRELW
jgi:hypothetical protein